MNVTAALLLSIVFLAGSENNIKKYRVEIIQQAMLGKTVFLINQDSITVKSIGLDLRTMTIRKENYSISLTDSQRRNIYKRLKKIEKMNLHKEYKAEPLKLGDYFRFEFKFQIKESIKTTKIIGEKVMPIYNLILELNKITPSDLYYDDTYLQEFNSVKLNQ